MEDWREGSEQMASGVAEQEAAETVAEVVTSPEDVPIDETVTETKKEKSKTTLLESAYDLMDNLIVALLAVTVIFSFFFRLVGVDGASMNDTLADKDRLVLQTAFYTPDHGDIVVIYQESQPEEPLIKRVIATAGDSLRLDVENNAVYLKLAGENEWKLLDESDYVHYPLGWGIGWTDESGIENEVTVPDGCLFVMGDHRNNSRDSRYESIGFVPVEDVIGRAIFRVYPLSDFGTI